MRRNFIRIIVAALALGGALGLCPGGAEAAAQPRAVGARVGAELEASYEHWLGKICFVEASLGLDFVGRPGVKGICTFNVIFAEPSWTRGSWAWFAGAGVGIGYVDDVVSWPSLDGPGFRKSPDMGLMCGGVIQLGVDYRFPDIPLMLSLDMRPIFAFHYNDGDVDGEGREYGSLIQYYNRGVFGLIPTLGIRYSF